jgi:hypothetical protein
MMQLLDGAGSDVAPYSHPLQSIGHWRPHPEEGGRLFCRRTKQVRVWPPSTARKTCMYVCMNDMQRYPPVSSVGRSRQRYSIIIAGAPIQEAACEGHIATCSHHSEEGTRRDPRTISGLYVSMSQHQQCMFVYMGR